MELYDKKIGVKNRRDTILHYIDRSISKLLDYNCSIKRKYRLLKNCKLQIQRDLNILGLWSGNLAKFDSIYEKLFGLFSTNQEILSLIINKYDQVYNDKRINQFDYYFAIKYDGIAKFIVNNFPPTNVPINQDIKLVNDPVVDDILNILKNIKMILLRKNQTSRIY